MRFVLPLLLLPATVFAAEASSEPIRNNYWLLMAGIALGIIIALAIRGAMQAAERRNDD